MPLKIKGADYDAIKSAVTPYLTAANADIYRADGLSETRFLFDCLWAGLRVAGLRIGDGAGAPGDINVYAYADDRHIESALRQISREIYVSY